MKPTTVKSIMTKNLEVVDISVSLKSIEAIFKKRYFHHLPVIREDNFLVGIITKEDVLNIKNKMLMEKKEGLHTKKDLKAEDFMSPHPATLSPDDSIALAAEIILSNMLHALPITTEKGKLVGMLTAHDLLSHAYGNAYSEELMARKLGLDL